LNKLIIRGEFDLNWNRKVNCHIILSDEISINDIEENLINKLEFEDIGSPDFIPQKRSISPRSLKDLGKRLKEEHEDFRQKDDLYIGLLNASISDEDLYKILLTQDSIFGGKWMFDLTPI